MVGGSLHFDLLTTIWLYDTHRLYMFDSSGENKDRKESWHSMGEQVEMQQVDLTVKDGQVRRLYTFVNVVLMSLHVFLPTETIWLNFDIMFYFYATTCK